MQLDVGQRFDRYQIVRQLGHGISGESYEAWDTLLQRTVTLKLLHPWSTLPDAVRRQFFREMQTMSLLNHPAIASILDYSDVDRQLYLAHKYTSFGSLLGAEGRTWFSPPLSLEEALRYTVQLAQPLHYLHYNGSFHGALTLANILIQHNPAHSIPSTTQFLLTDANLAYFIRRYGHPPMTILPITAAPEQFYKRTTPASDQYALASLLYYWLANRLPFLGTPEEVKQQKLHMTALPLSLHNSLVPPALAQAVQRALSTSIEDRFPSLQAFAHALQQAYQPPVPEETNPALSVLGPGEKEKSNGHSADLAITGERAESLSEQVQASDPVQAAPAPSEPTSPSEVIAQSELSPAPPSEPQLSPLPDDPPSIPETIEEAQLEFPAIQQTTIAVIASTIEDGALSHHPNLTITSPYVETPYEVVIDREEMTIGRAGSSDILLDYDPFTSRHHALLQQRDGQYVISDRSSAYGTTVNGLQLANEQRWPLQEGDQISIGQYKIVFSLSSTQGTCDQTSQNAQM